LREGSVSLARGIRLACARTRLACARTRLACARTRLACARDPRSTQSRRVPTSRATARPRYDLHESSRLGACPSIRDPVLRLFPGDAPKALGAGTILLAGDCSCWPWPALHFGG
jgi:hypothetical protein